MGHGGVPHCELFGFVKLSSLPTHGGFGALHASGCAAGSSTLMAIDAPGPGTGLGFAAVADGPGAGVIFFGSFNKALIGLSAVRVLAPGPTFSVPPRGMKPLELLF